jgi:hypothetical protein
MKVLVSILVVLALVGVIWFAQQANQPVEVESQNPIHQPVISRYDILSATDLVAGIKTAVANQDQKSINVWINKGVELAEAAGLSEEDVQYLQSDLAKNFLVFQAKRQLFNDEIQQAYYRIEDITPIKENYPEAQDLFVKVDKLISDRNNIIQQIATELATGKTVSDALIEAAGEKWKQQFTEKPPKLSQ